MSPRQPATPALDPREQLVQDIETARQVCTAKVAELQPIIDAADVAIEAGRRARSARQEAANRLDLDTQRAQGELLATADPAIQVTYDEVWEYGERVRANQANGPLATVFRRILRDIEALKFSAAHDIPEQLARLRAEAEVPPASLTRSPRWQLT